MRELSVQAEGNGATSLKIVLDSGTPYGELAHVGGTSSVLELLP